MPTTANRTPFARLLPPAGWDMRPDEFALRTERNENAGAMVEWPGWSEQVQIEVPPVGIVSRLRYLLEGTATTSGTSLGGGTNDVTATDAWPHGLVRRFVLRLNGQAVPWNLAGQDLSVMSKARFRNVSEPSEASTLTTSGSGGATTLRVMFDVPLSLDPAAAPNVGGLFAQSQNSQILAEITTGAKADVVTLDGDGDLAISANFRPLYTWYSIPAGEGKDGNQAMILPDLTVLHGAISQEVPVTQTGEFAVELRRVAGTVARIWVRLKNGADASLNPESDLDEVRFGYASNQRPRVYYPRALAWQNQEWYRGMLPYSAIAIDQLAENLTRDAVDVENLSNPQLTFTIGSGVSLDASARAHVVYEMLAPLA